jgi:two-component system, NarL family, response regulator DesR
VSQHYVHAPRVRPGREVIRVLVAEAAAMIRGGLVALLGLEDDLTVIAEVGRGDEILTAAQRWQPDVALIDADLPGLDGLSAARQLRSHMPDCRLLITICPSRPGTVRRALDAGIDSFVMKDAPPEHLADAVRKAAAGERVFNPELALAAVRDGVSPLTLRQAEVLLLTAQGASPQEIAARLHLSSGTVRNYLTCVVRKLNARNRMDAVRIAKEAGWLS